MEASTKKIVDAALEIAASNGIAAPYEFALYCLGEASGVYRTAKIYDDMAQILDAQSFCQSHVHRYKNARYSLKRHIHTRNYPMVDPATGDESPSLEERLTEISSEIENRSSALPLNIESEYWTEYERLIEAIDAARNAAEAFAPAFARAGLQKI